jgi:acetyltransferase-like isoleucine patch superfamily enzyme
VIIRRAIFALYRQYLIKRDPKKFARSIGVTLGQGCWLPGFRAGTFGSEPYLVSLGQRVLVSSGVQFVTHDGGAWMFRGEYPDIDLVAPISVGDDVVLGINAILMPGVTIGSRVVVGAGSVVTKDVPDGVVVAGVPARVICDIDDYQRRVFEKAIHVGNLSPVAKRTALTHRFG